jgi:hypothetical protein
LFKKIIKYWAAKLQKSLEFEVWSLKFFKKYRNKQKMTIFAK